MEKNEDLELNVNLLSNVNENNQRSSSFLRRNTFVSPPDSDNTENIQFLGAMGFYEGMVRKLYNVLHPRDINEAIDLMTEVDEIIQHDFYLGKGSKFQCYICKKERKFHINSGEKPKIEDAKVSTIKCFYRKCDCIIKENLILKVIEGNTKLINKYTIFKQRAIIFFSKDKKFCPEPDCTSYLQEDLTNKYVQCENGHKYCYICLKKWHDDTP